MSPDKNQTQQRFFLAIILSLGVLLAWTYFFPPPKPDESANANTAANVETAQTANTNSSAVPLNTPAQTVQNQPLAGTPDDIPNRVITVKTPLYEVKLDSRGALVSSWILLKNTVGEGRQEKLLYNGSSTKDEKFPLELISDKARETHEIPLKFSTGDANFDAVLNDKNYQISGADANEVVLSGADSRKIDFTLRDEATQTEIVKSITIRADSYVSDLQTKLTRGGQPVQNAKLLVGASIGDQGIKHYNYYLFEPEVVAVVNDGTVERHKGAEFSGKNAGRLLINGTVDWAGVGDTYFAMAAIPAQRTGGGLELQSTAFDVPLAEPRTNGILGFFTGEKITTETRHLVSAFVPVNTDGTSVTKLYVGTKDHFLLAQTSKKVGDQIGRTLDLESFVNYGWMHYLTRPIAVPIIATLNWLSSLTGNYGVAILLFTVLFYSLLFPMRWFQSRSFKKAAKNAPKMKEMQEKLKEMQAKNIPAEDPRMRELQMEQLKLTKDAVPLGGCLPLLLQFPLLIALYIAITISLDFRQASFLWLPDLSAADPFHILEFAFAGSMALSMMFTPTAAAVTPEQQMQQKMMTYMMPLMMLWVMWSAPSGLLLYWLTGNIIGFLQQMLINRLTKSNDDTPTATTGGGARTMSKKELKATLSPS